MADSSSSPNPDLAEQVAKLTQRLDDAESQVKHLKDEVRTLKKLQPNKLVLCFDGTGNQYLGTEEDTNIVKIYEMLNRNTTDQYHYYQRQFQT
jgi:uncharacterized protein (DUF2235 family)